MHNNKKETNQWPDKKCNLKTRTSNIENFYREEGYKCVTCWDCQYDKYISHKSKTYLSEYLPPYFIRNRGTLSQEKIKRNTANGKLYGFCQVDLECPERDVWPEDVIKPPHCEVSPKLYYSEHPPIFANMEIPFSDLGATIQEHIVRMDL